MSGINELQQLAPSAQLVQERRVSPINDYWSTNDVITRERDSATEVI